MSQIAAVTEDRQYVALARTFDLGLKAGERPKEVRPMEPVLGFHQRIQDLDRLQVILQKLLHPGQADRIRVGAHRAEDRFAVFNPQMAIFGKLLVRRPRRLVEFRAEPRDKGRGTDEEIHALPIGGDFPLVGLPRDEPFAIVAQLGAQRKAQIIGLQVGRNLTEHAELEKLTVHLIRWRGPVFRAGHQRPPCLGHLPAKCSCQTQPSPALRRFCARHPATGRARTRSPRSAAHSVLGESASSSK